MVVLVEKQKVKPEVKTINRLAIVMVWSKDSLAINDLPGHYE
jgi:hypothetical protein